MTRKILKRILIGLALFGLLVFVGRIGLVAEFFFVAGFIVGLIPVIGQLILTAVVAGLVYKVFRHTQLTLTLCLSLLICQAVIFFSWFQGWTAVSAFRKHTAIGLLVVDPQFEQKFLIGFWLLAAGVFAVAIESLINSSLTSEVEVSGASSSRAQIGVLLFEVVLLLAVNSTFYNFKLNVSRHLHIPASLSPDGTREIQLVTINAWIDTNGVTIARRPQSPLWRTVGEIGDSLTQADGGRFTWSNDGTKVYLLLNFEKEKDFPILGFDFVTNAQLDPKSYVAKR